ncbi:SdpA family antimicrobial peptide system protein [Canibacter oris]|uniref:Antimicrobial peptide system SdpA family protein n=1 Tax=Canibacter oris TaxID=1365628 RepID=A0A840DI07_9MICO|nr:SdpA family antimicrobial peptide system protein [Canibacter oris]MBB4071353.1 antimicrobial peptide system SdpA family protein [Canibacter oris]
MRDNLAIAFFFCTIIATTVLSAVFFISNKAPSNVLFPKPESNPAYHISRAFPQGWGFFTRDAREPSFSIAFKDNENKFTQWTQNPTFSSAYQFGLNRTPRLIISDTTEIVSQMTAKSAWKDCALTKNLDLCVTNATPVQVTINPIAFKTACGKQFLMIKQEPIPFAYRYFDTPKQQSVILGELTCP